MSKKYTLTESRLREIINETVGEVLRENFMDNARTKLSYAKNVVLDNLPPMGMKSPRRTIEQIKYYIEGMENAIQNKRECSSRFLYNFCSMMQFAKADGYVKYYKAMRQLYNQMLEMGLCTDEYRKYHDTI